MEFSEFDALYLEARRNIAPEAFVAYLLMSQAERHHKELMKALEKLDKPARQTIIPPPIPYPRRS